MTVPPRPAIQVAEQRPRWRRRTLEQVLAGMSFPARKWQIVTQSNHWGAPPALRCELDALPEGLYADIDVLARVLAGTARTPVTRKEHAVDTLRAIRRAHKLPYH